MVQSVRGPLAGDQKGEGKLCCWFCESDLRRNDIGFYCPFAACPACKEDAGDSVLDGPETERWQSMREGGSLKKNLAEAGLQPRRKLNTVELFALIEAHNQGRAV